MERLLQTHHFRNSRRYPPLLRFIVEETLEGRGEFLKERLIGVKVFFRPTDYDTATDPIVRVTIAEIRKRIAQYYHEEEHDAELRIELQPGRYAPEFRAKVAEKAAEPGAMGVVAEEAALPVGTAIEAAAVLPIVAAEAASLPRTRRFPWLRRRYMVAAAVVVVLLCAAAVPAVRWMRPSAMDALWEPFFSSHNPILLAIPTDVGMKRDENGDPIAFAKPTNPRGLTTQQPNVSLYDHEALGENVVFSDMLAMLQITNMLSARHRDYRVKLNTETSLEDLQQGPEVLIGGLDNQWTMRALAPLRYHFAGSDEDVFWIADAKDPNNKRWSLNINQNFDAITRDYAILARVHNEQTGQPELIVAGIGMSGTAAAGDLLGDPHRMEEVRRAIGRNFKDRDFEVVLSTDVVHGIAGEPKVLAVASW
jgi:hypothetical protein